MTKPVLEKMDPRRKKAIKAAKLEKERITGDDGRVRTVYRLDAGSGRFDVEFSKAFSLSVARARKENKRVAGSPDIARAEK